MRGIYLLFDPLKWKKTPWEKSLCSIFPFICAIQLRSPLLDEKSIENIAYRLKKILSGKNIPLIINNFVGLACRIGADGVHLGEKDMSINEAQKIFTGIIGASRHTVASALIAAEQGADYIGAGPVFPTLTKKTGRLPLGPEGFKKIKDAVEIPVIPVGGINPFNRRRLEGVSDIAAVSAAINDAEDPAETLLNML